MGMGATNVYDRVLASLGGISSGVDPTFKASADIPNGGVMLALPALLASGLLCHAEKIFQLPPGYYRMDTIFLLLAFMALSGIKFMEHLRYCSPGEWGKILGIDRIPEVNTLREKIEILSSANRPSQWLAELSSQWMNDDPLLASVLYIDGHVRVYNGHQTNLPKHYVARQKLCLRATADYWINAMNGQPFFVISTAVDPGLLQILENEIIPRLESDVPCQPSDQELESDNLRHRFTVVFDREGYSPAFILRMKTKRIACLTYHKHQGEDWPENEFSPYQCKLAAGHLVEMPLAERGVFLGGKLWVREIRKLSKKGHQTSIISTDFQGEIQAVAAGMFARWSQENFFKYMRCNYNLDRVISYSTEPVSETTMVVNPDYRKLDSDIRKNRSLLNRRKLEFASLTLDNDLAPKKVEEYQQKKADLQEEIGGLESIIEGVKADRKKTQKHISVDKLPEKERFERLDTQSKYFIDTIRLIAYRAETSMANILRETMSKHDEARILLRSLYSAEADLVPDYEKQILTVRIHPLANNAISKSIRHLCENLNDTETTFPGSNLRLVYDLVS